MTPVTEGKSGYTGVARWPVKSQVAAVVVPMRKELTRGGALAGDHGTETVLSEHTRASDIFSLSENWSDLVGELLQREVPVTARVRGVSMDPTIRDGDLVVLRSLGDGPAKPGDVIAFVRGPVVCLHRVIAVVHSGPTGRVTDYLTAGDGLLVNDGTQPADTVLGKVVKVKSNGGDWAPNTPVRRLQSFLRTALSAHPTLRAGLREAKVALRGFARHGAVDEGRGGDR